MSFFNSFITFIISNLPKGFAKPFAKPYVAGITIDDALSHVHRLNNNGFDATVDILGEHVSNVDEARNITAQYCQLYQMIAEESLQCTISVKPTHIGLNISLSEAVFNMTAILEKAQEFGNFLRIDMENSVFTNQTFEIFEQCKPIYDNMGVAIQSYLFRSQEDIERLADSNFNSRICKGIYKESSSIAFQDREDIKNNFLILAKSMAERNAFSGYATHDQDLIDKLLDWIETENISPNLFEFQVLFGVPMEGRLEALLEKGYRVRVYVPYGPDWFNYSIRRLKENPNIAGYVLWNMFKK